MRGAEVTDARRPGAEGPAPGRGSEERRRRGSTVTGGVALIATIVMLPVAMLFVVVWLAGWQLGFVRTGSMDPVLPPGSMIVSSPMSADEVEVGMVMQFVDPRDNGRMITHRVIEVNRDDAGQLSFVTKGDANVDRDTAEVPAENVRAEVRWHVKHLGSLLWAVRWPRSLGFTLVPLLLVGLGLLLCRRDDGPTEDRARRAGSVIGSPAPCTGCHVVIDEVDRYCRRCGTRQPVHRRPPTPGQGETALVDT